MSKKSAVSKVADALAAQSRILRRAAEEQDTAALDRLRAIGEAEHARRQQQKFDEAAAQVADLQPLLVTAKKFLADADAARKDAEDFLNRFEAVKWDDVYRAIPASHGTVAGTERSTRSTIQFMRARAKELRELVTANDGDLRAYVKQAEVLTKIQNAHEHSVVEGLRYYAQRAGSAGHVRSLTGVVRKLMAEVVDAIGDDFAPADEPVSPPPPTVLLDAEQVYQFEQAMRPEGR